MKNRLLLIALFSVNVYATPVNINTADAQTIANSLTGIGIKKAEAIVANREKQGRFKTVAELERVAGIGKKTIATNKADILLSQVKINRHSRTRHRHSRLKN